MKKFHLYKKKNISFRHEDLLINDLKKAFKKNDLKKENGMLKKKK